MNALGSGAFRYVSQEARKAMGLALGDEKRRVVETRLRTLAEEAGLPGPDAVVAAARKHKAMHTRMLAALTTNETFFFRNRHAFTALTESVFPALQDKRSLRIWSAACSSGQEAYSVAICVRESPDLCGTHVSIVGTDVDAAIVAQARKGAYTELEMTRGLSLEYRRRYFERCPEQEQWSVGPKLRSMVDFRRSNLVEPWTWPAPMDIVFISNVLFYFDRTTQRSVLERVARYTAPGGVVVLGNGERPHREMAWSPIKPAGSGVYRLPDKNG